MRVLDQRRRLVDRDKFIERQSVSFVASQIHRKSPSLLNHTRSSFEAYRPGVIVEQQPDRSGIDETEAIPAAPSSVTRQDSTTSVAPRSKPPSPAWPQPKWSSKRNRFVVRVESSSPITQPKLQTPSLSNDWVFFVGREMSFSEHESSPIHIGIIRWLLKFRSSKCARS